MIAQQRLQVGAVEEMAGKGREQPASRPGNARRKGRPETRAEAHAPGSYRGAV